MWTSEVGVRRAPVDTGRHREIGPVSPVKRNIQGQGMSEGLCWWFRGNHERWRRHSVFTQLRGVSIPQRASQLNCSTAAYARACEGRPRAVVRTPAGTTCTHVVPAGAHPAVRIRFPLPELSCPVSAASTASAPASAAGRSAATGRAASAGGTRTARRAAPGVTGAAGARRPAGPPAVAAPAPPPAPVVRGPNPLPAPPGSPDRRAHDGRHDEQARQDDKGDDGHNHDVTLLSFPRGGPRGRLAVLRDGGMPARLTCQSRVEEVQSFGAG